MLPRDIHCAHKKQKDLAKNPVQCQTFVNTVMNVRLCSLKLGEFLDMLGDCENVMETLYCEASLTFGTGISS
jgi:hypothetical protein